MLTHSMYGSDNDAGTPARANPAHHPLAIPPFRLLQ